MEVYKKKKIPKALREQVWIQKVGKKFSCKCKTSWCTNTITVFDFQCGHDVPEVKGGLSTVENLVPICGRCNLSMGSQYTFKEWCKIYKPNKKWNWSISLIFPIQWNSSDTMENGSKSRRNPMSQKDKQQK